MARIDTLGNFLTDVASAIKEKKGDSTNIAAEDFDTEIENLPSGGGKYAPRKIDFQNYKGTDLDYEIANLDISNITDMSSMFYACTNLTRLDISDWTNTSNVTNTRDFLHSCMNLTSIVINLDTSKLTSVYSFFENCKKLESIILGSNFKCSSCTDFSNMFKDCQSITTLDLTNLDTRKASSMITFVAKCTNLEHIEFGENFALPLLNFNYNNMFFNCPKLDNDTLNSILHILITMPVKNTLKNIGLTSTQATTCESLSNYQEFIDAGWTTGY